MDAATVQGWFADPVAVAHYSRAAVALGLWRSEEAVFGRVFRPDDRLLDAGCGAGRIAFGLWRIGYRQLTGFDYCQPMVEEARRLAAGLAVDIEFHLADATSLPFGDRVFDGVIFGFNGLMQIPGRRRRREALLELRRVTTRRGSIVFTTHDRALPAELDHWRVEADRWRNGQQTAGLVEFGDRLLDNPEGRIFMHLPDRAEVLEDLAATGWRHVADQMRPEIANEPPGVRDFSDTCRFWIASNGAA